VTGMENLSMAGGVALNAVANRRIRKESGFKQFFFQPAAGDAGGALGAAALAYQSLGGQAPVLKLSSLYLGPQFSNSELLALLSSTGIKFEDYRNQEDLLIEKVTERLLANQVVGWFQGRMEFGPRALGARSILANPMGIDIKERINTSIKKRETFRPFAPIVLQAYQNQHFTLDLPIPFMNEISLVESTLDLPAITHVDGTARPQSLKKEDNPRLAKLLQIFYQQTGCPMLVNTSFNQRGEPIVCTPVDALICMGVSALDALVIGDFLIKREDIPENWPELLAAWGYPPANQRTDPNTGTNNLYSFT
jgi:carbamoyltransferase